MIRQASCTGSPHQSACAHRSGVDAVRPPQMKRLRIRNGAASPVRHTDGPASSASADSVFRGQGRQRDPESAALRARSVSSTQRTGSDEFAYNRVQRVTWSCGAARAARDGSALTTRSAPTNATLHDTAVVHQPRKAAVALRSRGAVVITRPGPQKRGEADRIGCR